MWRRPAVTVLMLTIAMILTPPLRAQQKPVAPGLSPVPAALKGGATTAISTPAKPFTEEQISNMVRDGFGDESGAKLIEQRGIDFAPTEDLYQTLKAAGASEAFLKALRAAKPSEPASAKKPINQVQVFALLAGQVPSHRVTMLVQERGIDFEPTDDYLQNDRPSPLVLSHGEPLAGAAPAWQKPLDWRLLATPIVEGFCPGQPKN